MFDDPCQNAHQEDSIYVYDLSILTNLYNKWTYLMNDIKPYYAVKCNPNVRVLSQLSSLGCNFDCASPKEIDLVLSTGIDPSRIIYANPCKKESDIKYAIKNGVLLTTFDSICELEKIAKIINKEEMKLVLRIYANDESARCVLSNKYGAYKNEWISLLEKAKELKLNIVGISFHVGSGANNPEIYYETLKECYNLANVATNNYGFTIELIDIGGGFTESTLFHISESVANGKEEFFKNGRIKIIAEPGRYFVETVATLYTKIINVREREDSIEYWLTDGLYGSFNSVLYDHANYDPEPLVDSGSPKVECTLWGPTCDGFDKIATKNISKMKYGDWLVWKNAGAYTIAGACDFNGINFSSPNLIYI